METDNGNQTAKLLFLPAASLEQIVSLIDEIKGGTIDKCIKNLLCTSCSGCDLSEKNIERFYFRLIMAAMYPAPKPLSILTTATLELQLFNMANSAVRPPRLVP